MIPKHPEYQYLDLLKDILETGTVKHEFNTGTELKSVFGRIMRFDLSQGFPLLTTKKVFTRGLIHELLWFLSGSSNIKYLVDNDVHIWDEWAWKRYHKHALAGEHADMSQDEFINKLKSEPVDSQFVKQWGDLITI